MKVLVHAEEYDTGTDWITGCDEHGGWIQTSAEWIDAMEAAWGHIAMHHSGGCKYRNLPRMEWSEIVGVIRAADKLGIDVLP